MHLARLRSTLEPACTADSVSAHVSALAATGRVYAGDSTTANEDAVASPVGVSGGVGPAPRRRPCPSALPHGVGPAPRRRPRSQRCHETAHTGSPETKKPRLKKPRCGAVGLYMAAATRHQRSGSSALASAGSESLCNTWAMPGWITASFTSTKKGVSPSVMTEICVE